MRPVALAVYMRSGCLFTHKACYHRFLTVIHDSAKGKKTEHSILGEKVKENSIFVDQNLQDKKQKVFLLVKKVSAILQKLKTCCNLIMSTQFQPTSEAQSW